MTQAMPDIHGYNGIYTLQNVATGEHRTMAVKRQKDDARFAPGERIVALLTGSDNESSYTSFGFVHKDGTIATWKRLRGGAYDHYARMIGLALRALDGEAETLEGSITYMGREYKVMVSKRCYRCNRRLTTPESIRRGLGPECAGKMGL